MVWFGLVWFLNRGECWLESRLVSVCTSSQNQKKQNKTKQNKTIHIVRAFQKHAPQI